MKLGVSEDIRALDESAIGDYSMSGLQLMENAGRGVAEVVDNLVRGGESRGGGAGLGRVRGQRIAVFTGKGNNGGDGFVAARHLSNMGYTVTVYGLAKVSDLKGDALVNAAIWERSGGETKIIEKEGNLKKHYISLLHSSVIVDGLLGTGVSGEVTGLYSETIDYINTLGKRVVAIDVPSGLDGSTGALMAGDGGGSAIRATVTATIAVPKVGLYITPGSGCAGSVELLDMGVPAAAIEGVNSKAGDRSYSLIDPNLASGILSPREISSHKGSNGHLALIGGGPGKTGALLMASMAALRSGAGLVTAGVAEGLVSAVEAKTLEVMTAALPSIHGGDGSLSRAALGGESVEEALSFLEGKSSLVVGPGLDDTPESRAFMEGLLRGIDEDFPVVIDAGGLSALSGNLSAVKSSKGHILLTPHPGECGRLLGITAGEVQSGRLKSAEALSRESGALVLLKGAGSIIADCSGGDCGEILINSTGSPVLGTAGTGDILAGVIGGLTVQGCTLKEAAVLGAYSHGRAGDIISEGEGTDRGVLATDLLGELPSVLGSLIG